MPLDSTNFKDDISVINGSKNELVVFEKENDTLSFLELLKLNNFKNIYEDEHPHIEATKNKLSMITLIAKQVKTR